MKKRYRIGAKAPILVNIAVFVVHLDDSDAKKISDAIATIKTVLQLAGFGSIGARLVFEAS